MKSETEVRKELQQLDDDLKAWRYKYERASPADNTRRLILANTIVGLEAQMEALKWILEED